MLAETLAPPATQNADLTTALTSRTRGPTNCADALSINQTAHEAHVAVCAAYSAVEDRVFAGEIAKDAPEYIAAEAATYSACDAASQAWVDLMDTPATSMEEVRAKLAALLIGEGIVHPEREQVRDAKGMLNPMGAICRIAVDLERQLQATAPPMMKRPAIGFAQRVANAKAAFEAIALVDKEEDAVDEALSATEHVEIPAPACLYAVSEPFYTTVICSDGTRVELAETEPSLLKTPKQILRHHKGDQAAAEPMLRALAEWHIASAEANSEREKLRREYERLSAKWGKCARAAWRAARAVIACPASSIDEVIEKTRWQVFALKDWEDESFAAEAAKHIREDLIRLSGATGGKARQ